MAGRDLGEPRGIVLAAERREAVGLRLSLTSRTKSAKPAGVPTASMRARSDSTR
ncbi:MAG TPA: hypothetical protein VGH35_02760 [Gaiellaceae bacterium]